LDEWRFRQITESLAEQYFTPQVSVTLIGDLAVAGGQDQERAQCKLQFMGNRYVGGLPVEDR
jgi:hypothetical protein